MHAKLVRDEDGRPIEAVHVHGYVPEEDSLLVQKGIWESLGRDDPLPKSLGAIPSR